MLRCYLRHRKIGRLLRKNLQPTLPMQPGNTGKSSLVKFFISYLFIGADASCLTATVEDFTHVSDDVVTGEHGLHVETRGAC